MDTNEKTATIYDFNAPGHKLNTRWPVLDLVGGSISLHFANVLSEKLQLTLRGEAKSVDRLSYADCLASIEQTCIVHELSIAPLPGMAWFCMDTSVISAIVECYFGGKGQLIPLDAPRNLSYTEMRVLKHIIDSLLTGVAKGWSMVRSVQPGIHRQLPVSRLSTAARQPVMIISQLALRMGEVELPFQLMYPHDMLSPVSEQLQHEPEKIKKQDDAFSYAIRRELMNCELDIRGVLAETQITLGKLLELKAGDFIPLRDVQNVSFKTSNLPLFDAQVGSTNGRVSASLSRWHLPMAH